MEEQNKNKPQGGKTKQRTVIASEPERQDFTNEEIKSLVNLPKNFSSLGRLVMRDLNGNAGSPTFYLYTREQINQYLQNPYSNQKNIRDAVIYLYGVSSHFRRVIQYFTSLTDLAYVISPRNIDTATANPKSLRRNFYKTANALATMDIRNQGHKIVTVCIREDVYYCTMWVNNESIIFQQLPSDYCQIAVIEDNVPNVSFDFSYFDANSANLPNYPAEFQSKYRIYQGDRNMRWQELDSPNSFAVKCNSDILNYALPPFAGILREVYDLEDYKQLQISRTELENYAMLVMKLGLNDDGTWEIDLPKAKEFYRNLDGVLPEQIGSVLSPMEIEKITFNNSDKSYNDTVSEAEESLFTAAGVSSLLFNNKKAAASALALSIKADQAMTYRVVKSLEAAINRFIHAQAYGKNFNVTFLDCSPYNRKEAGDAYIKACQYGIPMISHYAATQGLTQIEVDSLNFLEDSVLDFKSRFVPLSSATTQSSSGEDPASETGRPTLDDDEISESGEQTREAE